MHKSRFHEMLTILTMLEKAYDLEQRAAAHEEDGVIATMRTTRNELCHRLTNAAAVACHEYDSVGCALALQTDSRTRGEEGGVAGSP